MARVLGGSLRLLLKRGPVADDIHRKRNLRKPIKALIRSVGRPLVRCREVAEKNDRSGAASLLARISLLRIANFVCCHALVQDTEARAIAARRSVCVAI